MGSIITFLIGMVAALLIVIVLNAFLDEGVVCPSQIEAATRMRLFYAELPPELTEYDVEFSEACDLNWQAPVKIEPPERGA
jgi:hypothetical protein